MDAAGGIEVVIPHFNRAEGLRRTLDSLRRQTLPTDVCVVDNGSTDHSRVMLATDFPEVRLFELDTNRGFGAAVNAAARTSSAETLVLLNNDAVADEHFIDRIEAQRQATGAEMIAACLRKPDGRVESLGLELDSSLIGYEFGYGRSYPLDLEAIGREPFGASGGAAAYDRRRFLELSGFDERFFAYLEDLDLAVRMRLAGLRFAVAPDAFAWHEHSATLGSGSKAKNRLMGRSRAYFLWKHGAGLSTADRGRAFLIDAVVYAGQILTDRNAEAARGRLDMARELRGMDRPGSTALPRDWMVQRGVREALRIRAARRR